MDSEGECNKEYTFSDKEKVRDYMEKNLSEELNQTTGLSSLFHRLIPKIAQKADNKNVSIVVSDFITSNHTDNATHSLEMLKGIDIKDKSFYLLGYQVDYKGFFWFSNNRKTFIETVRPFYILFIGTPDQIINLKKMNFWKEDAFGEFYSLNSLENTAETRLLKGRNNIKNVEADIINKQIKIKGHGSIKFTFEAILTDDLENLYSESYLLDKKNYELSDNKYQIENITVDKEENTKKYLFTITSEEPNPSNLEFRLKVNQIPKWIENNSLNITDEEKEKTKTFGFYELVSNLAKNNKNTLQLFNITIKD